MAAEISIIFYENSTNEIVGATPCGRPKNPPTHYILLAENSTRIIPRFFYEDCHEKS